MRQVVDTGVLVGELLRASGRERLADDRLDLFLPERMWGEAKVVLPRRIAAFFRPRGLDRSIGDDLVAACVDATEGNIVAVDEAIYSPLEVEALARSSRDPADWLWSPARSRSVPAFGPTTTTSSEPALRPGPPTPSSRGSSDIGDLNLETFE